MLPGFSFCILHSFGSPCACFGFSLLSSSVSRETDPGRQKNASVIRRTCRLVIGDGRDWAVGAFPRGNDPGRRKPFHNRSRGGSLKLTAGNRVWFRRPISREIDGGKRFFPAFSGMVLHEKPKTLVGVLGSFPRGNGPIKNLVTSTPGVSTWKCNK
jgi:hypothetical protein